MKQLSVANLTSGMIAAEDITSHDGQVIVPEGVVLTQNIIARLENYCIYYVNVEADRTRDLSCPIAPQPADASITGLYDSARSTEEKAAVNEQFNSFLGAFKRCSEHYRAILTGSVSRNEPFTSDDLLKEVISLLRQDGREINIFDILLNMRSMDNSIYSHCIGVALISNALSRWLGFSRNDQMMATACGLFHDCGILMLPLGISEKSGKLTPNEQNIIKTHPIEGFHLLSRYRSIPEPVKDAALSHHERCDGSGYPYGLKNDEISSFTKIVMIADTFDTIISDKAYRMSMCPFSVIKYFEDDGLQKYDAEYVLTFLEHVLNLYLRQKITLCGGMDGNVVFISRRSLPQPAIQAESNKDADLQKDYYNSIMLLSNMENLSIESII